MNLEVLDKPAINAFSCPGMEKCLKISFFS